METTHEIDSEVGRIISELREVAERVDASNPGAVLVTLDSRRRVTWWPRLSRWSDPAAPMFAVNGGTPSEFLAWLREQTA